MPTAFTIMMIAASFWLLVARPTSVALNTSHSEAVAPNTACLDCQRAGQALPELPPPGNALRFDHYTIEDGLSQSSGNCFFQDSQGFMWIGTEDGLNRFDGYGFAVYRNDPGDPASLTNNYVNAIVEGPPGTLWVATYGGGLDQLDLETGQFVHHRHDPQNANSLSDDQILALHRARDGTLWMGTRGGGLNRFDPETRRWQHYWNDPENPQSLGSDDVTVVFEDAEGLLWIGTSGGLNRLEPGTGVFARFGNDPADPDSLSRNLVTSIVQDASGILWIGMAGGGLDRLDPDDGTFRHHRHSAEDIRSLSSDTVTSLAWDGSGLLWVGTDRGVNRLDPIDGAWNRYQHDPAYAHSLSDDGVESLYSDRFGGLWIGTGGGGLDRYDLQRDQFALYRAQADGRNGLTKSTVWDIHQDGDGVLWIGTDGGGLTRFERQNHRWTHHQHDPEDPTSLSSDVVVSIFEDRQGLLWVGTWGGGLDRFNRDTGEFDHFRSDPSDPNTLSSNIVWALHEDRQGTLWVGTARGLNAFDPASERFTRYYHDPDDPHSLSDNDVGAILEDQQGMLWFGTHAGLNRYDPATGQFTRYQHDLSNPESLSHDIVFVIHEDQAGRLWLGTWGGGLNRFEPERGTFKHYRTGDGLPNDVVYGILEDRPGHLWLSTNGGLARFDPETETFWTYDARDGLQSNEFDFNSYAKGQGGEFFFGGISGFNSFFPEAIQGNQHLPRVVLTALTQRGEAVASGMAASALDQLTLRAPNNQFEFEFAALSFYQPEENLYAYKLDGFEREWNEVGTRRFGSYTNLPGGSYTLLVRSSNNDGVWNEETTELDITIVPPFWATWWFRGLLALGVVGLVVGAYQLRVRSIEGRRRELEAQVASRTRKLEAMNAIASVVSRSLDLDRVLSDALDTTLEVTGLEAGGIYLLQGEPSSREGGVLRIAAHEGLGLELVQAIDNLVVGEGFSGRVVETCEPLVVDDLANDPRLTRTIVKEAGFRSLAIAPLVSRAKVLGSLFVISRNQKTFLPQDIDLLIAIGGQIGVAVESARLFEAEQRRAEQFRVISEAGHHLTSILDVDELLSEIVQSIQETFGYYEVGIGLIEGDELVIKTSSGIRWQDLEGPPIGLAVEGETVMNWVLEMGEPLSIPDVRRDPRYVLWPHTAETLSELAVPLRTKSGVIGVLNVESDQLDAFDESDVMVLQSLANQAAIAIENARFFEAEQRRAEQFRMIAEAGRRMTLTLGLDDVLGQMVRLVQQAFGYYHVGIGLVEADEVVYRFGAGDLWLAQDFEYKPHRLRVGEQGITGWVAATGEPLLVSDVNGDPRYVWMEGSKTRSELTVPIVVKERVIGVLDAQSDQVDTFDETDLVVLQSVAHQVGAAIENARLYEQAQQAAVLEERGRLARELHDAVTQTLFSASLIAEAVPPTWDVDQQEGRELLQELQRLTRGALAEMRTLLLELRPAALVEASLNELLRQLAESVAGRLGMPVDLTIEGECSVHPDVHVALYRIAQEALNNVVKHARAHQVRVALRCVPPIPGPDGNQRLELRVCDDGRGFDPERVSQDHLGLGIMRERAEAIGAALTIESQPDGGTQVVAVWQQPEASQP